METKLYLRGRAASPGVAYGEALVRGPRPETHALAQPHAHWTLDDFDRSVQYTKHELRDFLALIQEKVPEVVSQIVEAHIQLLKDPLFVREMADLIDRGAPVITAINEVVSKYSSLLSESRDERVKEKSQDLRDLGMRLIKNLDAKSVDTFGYQGRIVILHELLPSDVLDLVAEKAEGAILTQGGITAHVSLLARALELPMVTIEPESVIAIDNGTKILLDASLGSILVNPPPAIMKQYKDLLATRGKISPHEPVEEGESTTADGRRIFLFASINLISELKTARHGNAEGIGLYRSEMPFLLHNHIPSQEQQQGIYRRLVSEMPSKELVFRTIDLGGDKILEYFPHELEFNPSLGLRGIRFALSHPELFKQQIRAILRSAFDTHLRILFPLIPSLDVFFSAKELIRECIKELEVSGEPYNRTPNSAP